MYSPRSDNQTGAVGINHLKPACSARQTFWIATSPISVQVPTPNCGMLVLFANVIIVFYEFLDIYCEDTIFFTLLAKKIIDLTF